MSLFACLSEVKYLTDGLSTVKGWELLMPEPGPQVTSVVGTVFGRCTSFPQRNAERRGLCFSTERRILGRQGNKVAV